MPEEQIVGDRQPLDRKVTTPPTATSKQGATQLVGDSVPLSRNEVLPPTHTLKQGATQIVGDSVSLNRTPQKPWAQANLPTSPFPNMAPTGGKK